MNEFTNVKNGYELIVRKKISAFIEKTLRSLGYLFSHDTFKKIIYSEIEPKGEFEEMCKDYYDAYYYLLSNHKRPFTMDLINRFFYLLKGRKPDEAMTVRMTARAFAYITSSKVEDMIQFHLIMYDEMTDLAEKERTIVSLMLLNYGLLKLNIPTIKVVRSNFEEYIKLRTAYFKDDSEAIYTFMFLVIKENKYQEKSYYQNLKELPLSDLVKELKKDQEFLEKYGIKTLILFGSYAKGEARIDSDIDLLYTINDDKSTKEKEEIMRFLEEHYFNKFHRFIDFTEVSEYLTDEFIKEMSKIEIIFKGED